MKRFGILVLVALLIMGMAAGTSLAEPQKGQVMKLTLDEAINYALENSPTVKLAEVSLQEAEKSYEQADSAKEQIEDNPYAPPGLDTKKIKELYPKQAERGYEMSKSSLDYTKRSIRLSVESAYYNVLSAEQKVAVNEATMERAQKQLDTANASFEAGTVAKNDVLGAEVQLDKAQADLNSVRNDLDIAYMELNRALGMDLNQLLELTTVLEYKPMEPIDLAETITKATESDVSLLGAEIDYENKKDAFELTAKFYTPNVYTYRGAKLAMDKALVNYDEAQKDHELRVTKAYLNLKAAEANYQVLVKSVERAKESLRLSKLRYEVGVATSLEVLQASEALQNQELYLAQALQSYNLVKAQFTHNVFNGGAAASDASSMPSGI